ncbi:MAG: GPW/gp25 family protein [Saprospiraceae bacterium]
MAEKIFYSMPFVTEHLGRKTGFQRCDLTTSVRQNIRLLLITPPGRVRFDPYYGCRIHWSQFLADSRAMEGKKVEDKFKQTMEENIEELIRRFEPRLDLKEVLVDIRQSPEDQKPWKIREFARVKRNVIQVIVGVRGMIKPEFASDGQSLELEDTIPLM